MGLKIYFVQTSIPVYPILMFYFYICISLSKLCSYSVQFLSYIGFLDLYTYVAFDDFVISNVRLGVDFVS